MRIPSYANGYCRCFTLFDYAQIYLHYCVIFIYFFR